VGSLKRWEPPAEEGVAGDVLAPREEELLPILPTDRPFGVDEPRAVREPARPIGSRGESADENP
jgi:hypothetical protein